jgi:thymidylate synthase ThyX
MRTLQEIREYLIEKLEELSNECDASIENCKKDPTQKNLNEIDINQQKLLMVAKIAKFVVGD